MPEHTVTTVARVRLRFCTESLSGSARGAVHQLVAPSFNVATQGLCNGLLWDIQLVEHWSCIVHAVCLDKAKESVYQLCVFGNC
jgi:hypothetical protein